MPGWNLDDRTGLMNAATSFYAVMVIVACLVWWAAGLDLQPQLTLGLWTVPLGLVAVVPMLPVLFFAGGLKDLVTRLLGQPLSRCRLSDLAALAVLAGIGEELLFRGALQEWVGKAGFLTGLIVTNVVFGLLHALTPLYFVIATAFGFYLSGLAELGGSRNLVAPMIAHAVYDFLGFLLIAAEWRKRQRDDSTAGLPPDLSDEAQDVEAGSF